MISDLRELYQELILDHNRRPRNFGRLEGANRSAEGYNPLCGDRIIVHVKLEDGAVSGISFEGSGCAISRASASVMTESVKGKSLAEVESLFSTFHGLVTGKPQGESSGLGKLAAFGGVRDYPARVKCATLAWHTLRAALRGEAETVSTE